MKALTIIEIAKIDILRLKLAELGYSMPDAPAEAIMAAIIQLKNQGKLSSELPELQDVLEPSVN